MLALAKANYEIEYAPDTDVSERIIFPYSPTETNGIEDARFVEFTTTTAAARYYATYTAFDGNVILPQLVETEDFLRFRISTLNGPEVRNKGMALFPRKIGGNYAMISRQDGENMYLMYSDMLHFWYTKMPLLKPTYPWEFVQVGNCGSPIETEAGWLVLTHGVGPMRKYAIGAILLDRDDPSKVIGRLAQPLLGARRERTRRLRAERRLQLRRRGPRGPADHPLRDERLRLDVRDGAAGGCAECDDVGVSVGSSPQRRAGCNGRSTGLPLGYRLRRFRPCRRPACALHVRTVSGTMADRRTSIGVIGCGGFGLFALQQFVQVPGVRLVAWPARIARRRSRRRSGLASRTSQEVDALLGPRRRRPGVHRHAAVSALRAGAAALGPASTSSARSRWR